MPFHRTTKTQRLTAYVGENMMDSSKCRNGSKIHSGFEEGRNGCDFGDVVG